MKHHRFYFLSFAFSIFLFGCTTTKITDKSPTETIDYGEQNVVPYVEKNYYTGGGGYITPSYELGTELKKVKTNYFITKAYAAKNNCNTDYVFVIDMRLPCYKKRFFVYDSKKDSLLTTALVAHGIGSETFKGELIFSNIPNSKKSSLGKYKVGESYNGLWGFSYKLRGLDSTNSKAFERAIVMHSYPTIPDQEVGSSPIAFSHGCPMVSPNFLQQLKGYITKASKTKKPILMSIIY